MQGSPFPASERQRMREAWIASNRNPEPELATRETPMYEARSAWPVVSKRNKITFKTYTERRQMMAVPNEKGLYDLNLCQHFDFDDGTFEDRVTPYLQDSKYDEAMTNMVRLTKSWGRLPTPFVPVKPDVTPA